ncbi:M12 family metallopeptidase [Pseudomonas sp. A34-9]|uniref:M12 family metallopeptidase n=1 Tax=Pseudomonas sp. A34-9 TaxID=3034675 RepID=UPI00240DA9A2|nr:M12 family metallopeptidase [Pseudomonas sp. A34-9]
MHNYHFVKMMRPGLKVSPSTNQLTTAVRHKRSVTHPNWLWENASTVTFSFKEDVPADLRLRIEYCIRQWEPYISLALELVEDGQGQIRIAVEGEASHSQLGTNALLLAQEEPTMVLGIKTDSPLFEKIVLHEFGHALGFHHAHLHPDANIPWDKPTIYAVMAKEGWDKEDVDENYFNRLPAHAVYGAYDKHSVMHYGVPGAWTFNRLNIEETRTLSEGDKNFARTIYPALDYRALPT